ncbi:UDP-3-O-(3-hydroxymyristoyl)glucosamine N-acyltransferase [Candidatus Hydrogenosomobacter endosymbioticus]|uniref:UDP-3-O-acylglucosamine N-acyltransferase n=1 Tax=Candidatus Hydrogenosomobacter endosymbioticus TaxID=2558174 RepID=A0ABM7V900_9PROT|nr:UDP-3-O-(3-hydroxymyristoyl)glucosamine N-acyltransferase [Candidatus Hydrogenosomobacter endosymbioticus]BDB96244.1 UDP-3-O-acylglucosamine N-acyltransferase [Candidatus Hydrogenosomobacter endosymbioticus]
MFANEDDRVESSIGGRHVAIGDIVIECGDLVSSFVHPEAEKLTVCEIAPLDRAVSGSVSFFAKQFLRNARVADSINKTKSTACFIDSDSAHLLPDSCVPLVTKFPVAGIRKAAEILYPQFFYECNFAEYSRIDGALIHRDSCLGKGCKVFPGSIVHGRVFLGEESVVGSQCVIGPNVETGRGCVFESCASVMHSSIGDKVYVKQGARIGQSGFGFSVTGEAPIDIPHTGIVVIRDCVQIGAGTSVDRGVFQSTSTTIGKNTRIDNLTQIGHNVTIGENVIIAAQCGIAGSVKIGDGCALGGQVGVAGHISIGSGTMVAAKSGVMRSCSERSIIAGIPAVCAKKWRRQVVGLWKMASREV